MENIRALLLQASDDMLDASMRSRIAMWDDPDPTAIQVLEVLDYCVSGALASGFVITVLRVAFEQALKRESLTKEEAFKLATWRKEMPSE